MPHNQYLRQEYIARINRVLDHIDRHIDQSMNLETLAGIANFSPYHFHRIFHAFIGETLNQFISRIRVERAASLLVNNPKKSITEIAMDCGFSGSATFARGFRDRWKVSASEWRNGAYRKICKTDSSTGQLLGKDGKALGESSYYIDADTLNEKWRITMSPKDGTTGLDLNVEVRERPEMTVAYVRHIGPYKGDEMLFKNLWERLMKWAGPRNLIRFPVTEMLCVYHDDPEITEDSKLRTSVCISVPADTSVDGEVGKMTIPAGKYAMAHFEINGDQYQEAWTSVYAGWLPESGYQPDDRPAFELCLNNPEEHPEHKHIVEICIPVKPL